MATERPFSLQEFPGPRTGGVIYFVRSGDSGPIKIGFTRGDASKRIAGLQTAHPEKLTLVAEIGGDREGESTLHAEFRHLRLRGEWFEPGADLLALIDEINTRTALMVQRHQAAMATVADM
ncbi:MAG TPA: GIY-YIG nuclease family protein, partial [Polyangiaceae bacterium]|nr:GIY-YIG nuclease family protein [Polyangiaceae bacterium]